MMRYIKKLIIIGLFFLVGFKGAIGFSQSRCTVSGASINFGDYNIFSPFPVDTTGILTLNCVDVVRAELRLSVSTSSGTFNPRKMRQSRGNDFLNYNIFIDAGRTIVFGDGTGGTSTIGIHKPPGPPKHEPWSRSIILYGRIPPGQDVSIGSYSDTLTITVEW